MCGRFELITPAEALRRLFGFVEQPNLAPRYNIAPTQEVPVLRQRRNPPGERTLQPLRWGLVPAGARDRKFAASLINARAETLLEKPAFAGAFRKRRCLVPADGFYEWAGEGDAKRAYLISRRDGAPFAFAGLWERWTAPDTGEASDSFTIVTTAANALLAPLHPRMPVILDPADHARWLDPDGVAEALQPLLIAAPESALHYWSVGSRVNSARIDEAGLLEPTGPEIHA
jgi:putative SOS response-associated peptidase YedK